MSNVLKEEGSNGVNGVNGVNGADGVNEADGADGVNGVNEADGVDGEQFINIEDIINNNQIIKLYQFQVNNENFIIKLVAETHKIPEIIIKENFGINNSFSLYSYIYDIDEITNNTCLPLIKLVKINSDNSKYIYSLCINYISVPHVSSNDFTIFFVNAINEKIIDSYTVPKNINAENIVEILLTMVIDLGTAIYT
jgi:hypothetical protein